MSAKTLSPASPAKQIDLETIAQRILKLAEIATLEHLESVAHSQAHRLIELSECDN